MPTQTRMPLSAETFTQLRYGLFVHYGLYSLLERGEWVMNRERISVERMRELATSFTAEKFDADALCDFAVRCGMRYIVLTSMHHEGFCLYRTELTDFNSWETCGRDLVAETIAAARKRGLYVGMYHSLNDWFRRPDAVDALENPQEHEAFLARVHTRVEEFVRNYDFDIMWYDGWWPFDGAGWRGEQMNAKLRQIRPHLLFNPRNGTDGDFGTPEQHLSTPHPWRPWEGCVTLNQNWGYHRGDDSWKSVKDVIRMLCQAASGRGNLLMNIGPKGDGSLPEPAVRVLEEVGKWKRSCAEVIEDTGLFTYSLEVRNGHRGDWSHMGPITVGRTNNCLYLVATNWAAPEWALCGLNARVQTVDLLPGGTAVDFEQDAEGTVRFLNLPLDPPFEPAPVLRLKCDRPPEVYNCGGMRIPSVPHPPYDPLPSDLPGCV